VAGWQSVKLGEIEAIPMRGSQGLLWQPLRRALDVRAVGINAFAAEKVGDDVVEEHTEEMLGHEEVYVVLSGRATFTLGGDTLDAPAGTVVFVSDAALKRHARAEEPGTAVLAIGGPRDAVYEPPAWEAERHRASGDYEAYAAELAEALEQRPHHAGLMYVLAGAEALAGRPDAALARLRRAVELRPTLAEVANTEEDFASLRDRPDWPF